MLSSVLWFTNPTIGVRVGNGFCSLSHWKMLAAYNLKAVHLNRSWRRHLGETSDAQDGSSAAQTASQKRFPSHCAAEQTFPGPCCSTDTPWWLHRAHTYGLQARPRFACCSNAFCASGSSMNSNPQAGIRDVSKSALFLNEWVLPSVLL